MKFNIVLQELTDSKKVKKGYKISDKTYGEDYFTCFIEYVYDEKTKKYTLDFRLADTTEKAPTSIKNFWKDVVSIQDITSQRIDKVRAILSKVVKEGFNRHAKMNDESVSEFLNTLRKKIYKEEKSNTLMSSPKHASKGTSLWDVTFNLTYTTDADVVIQNVRWSDEYGEDERETLKKLRR